MGQAEERARQAMDVRVAKLEAKGKEKKLIKLLDDLRYQNRAAGALARMGSAAAVPRMIEILDRSRRMPGTKYAFADALGAIGDPRAVDALIASLEWCLEKGERLADNKRFVLAAVGALGRIGDDRAAETLRSVTTAAVKASDGARWVVQRGMDEISAAASEALQTIDPSTADPRVAAQLAEIEALIAEIPGAKLTDQVKIIKRLASKRKAAVEPLTKACAAADPQVRGVAAEALGLVGDADALPTLATLMEDPEAEPRFQAALALGEHFGPAAVDLLAGALGSDRWQVREAAVRGLGAAGDDRSEGLLLSALHDPHPTVRETTLDVLSAYERFTSSEPVAAAVAECLDDETEAVRDLARRVFESMTGVGVSPADQGVETIEITGGWLDEIWKERPVALCADPDEAMAFLARDPLPYVWDDDPGYREHVDGRPDPQRELRSTWIAAYLNHPKPEVVLRTLREHVTPDALLSRTVSGWLPSLLIHEDPEMRTEAARRLWTAQDITVSGVMHVAAGVYPSIDRRLSQANLRQRWGDVQHLLREHCPGERRDFFEEQLAEIG